MFSGHVSPVMRQKAKGSRPKRNAERRAARRLVLPGFPISPRPFSKAEIEQYFSGDRIQCLVCGKHYRRLGRHLQVHDLTEDEYRELYGLPWRRGLCGKDAHAAYFAAIKKRMAEGFVPPCDAENRAKAHDAIRKRGIRLQPFRKEVSQENIAKSNGRDAWPSSMFEEIVRRVLTGRTVPNVCADKDVPGATWFRKHLAAHPEDKAAFLSAIDRLPFPTQADIGYGMGPRFWTEVARLRQLGQSDHVIGRDLGVDAMTVNRGRRQRGIS